MSKPTRPLTTIWFACATLISAFLVFQIQPVISRTILPWFGGSPAVWTTCMLFFQVLLFAGYAYAHVLTKLIPPRWQGLVHLGLVVAALLVLPIAPAASWKPTGSEDPTLRILAILLTNVGLPYFLLSSTGPLLQAWFVAEVRNGAPYRLYALSNLGSLTALLTYPFLFEPALSTDAQSRLWSLVFCLFAVVLGYLAAGRSRGSRTNDTSPLAGQVAWPTSKQRAGWLLLPAFASLMLLAITNHVCQDIAVIPFLWVVPLSLYLLTFIISFERETWYSRRWCGGAAIGGLLWINWAPAFGLRGPLLVELAVYFATLFCVCLVCHGELVRLKPAPRFLTSFYLLSAAGGALGGVTVGVVCPLVFTNYYELNCCLLVGAILAATVFLLDAQATWMGNSPPRRIIGSLGFLVVLFLVVLVQFGSSESHVIAAVRNFYGVLRVRSVPGQGGTSLVHGRIVHGFQFDAPDMQGTPTTYYSSLSGVGLTLKHFRHGQPQRVGVVGLGCGTLAAYGRAGDYYRFYEINPAVLDIARERFTYLKNCPARQDIILGDARISLEREPNQQFDVLVLDAFSGDSVPTHLLTREAFEVYRRHLCDDGVIAAHISNQHLDLEPVIERQAANLGWQCLAVVSSADSTKGAFEAKWLLVSAQPEHLAHPDIRKHLRTVPSHSNFPLWTDQFNNIVQLLRLHN